MKCWFIKIDSDETTSESAMQLHQRQFGLKPSYLFHEILLRAVAIKTEFDACVDFGFVAPKGELYNVNCPK